MPRTGRIILPDYPHHVVQRGHNRQIVFARPGDYARYLDDLIELKRKFDVKVHAYCLMPNHVHLLLAPATAVGIALLMKRLAGRHTRRRNARETRTGSLWEGRYKSSLVDRDSYLLACCRYIELNPVRAGLAGHPGDYRWSSYRDRFSPETGGWLDPDSCFLAMGETTAARLDTYARFVTDGVPDAQRELIGGSVQRGHPTGGSAFDQAVANLLDRPVERRGRGRPRKK